MISMRFFCTYFDRNYLPRGLALYRSLVTWCPSFTLWVLCMDEESRRMLDELGLPDIRTISLRDFEQDDSALAAAKANRTKIEYYFTCTPSLPLHILEHWPEVDVVTYLDADLYFFASPEPLFEEMGERSVAITAHRFPPALRDRERYGVYNVGWLSFRRDAKGLACLRWWRDRCNEWCYDREDSGRFADQKYLDDWPSRFESVVVLHNEGANVAPWNVSGYRIGKHGGGGATVDGKPLIFFHFHGLRKMNNWTYDPGWAEYGVNPSAVLGREVYVPYLKALFAASRELPRAFGAPAVSNSSRAWTFEHKGTASLAHRIVRSVRTLSEQAKGVIAGRLIFLPGG